MGPGQQPSQTTSPHPAVTPHHFLHSQADGSTLAASASSLPSLVKEAPCRCPWQQQRPDDEQQHGARGLGTCTQAECTLLSALSMHMPVVPLAGRSPRPTTHPPCITQELLLVQNVPTVGARSLAGHQLRLTLCDPLLAGCQLSLNL